MSAPSQESPVRTSVAPERLEPQAHGGALRRGGTNRGGPGRPRNVVRQLAIRGAARAVPRLIAIATDPGSEPRDVIAAARVLLEFGLGRQIEVDGQVDHEHHFVVEVPAIAASAQQWEERYRRALTTTALPAATPAPVSEEPSP
jgi:hypothetical protein